jgi:hypothetical protein
MGAEDVEVAGQFLAALEAAAESGDREAVYPLLVPDVEWVTPKRTLRGIGEIGKELTWGSPPEKLDLEFEAGDWVDLGDRRVACDVHQVYRWKETGAHEPPSCTLDPPDRRVLLPFLRIDPIAGGTEFWHPAGTAPRSTSSPPARRASKSSCLRLRSNPTYNIAWPLFVFSTDARSFPPREALLHPIRLRPPRVSESADEIRRAKTGAGLRRPDSRRRIATRERPPRAPRTRPPAPSQAPRATRPVSSGPSSRTCGTHRSR